ncbi:hypothetical protein LSTR_LSTR008701 [Laodelphax striatellus]|uniref:Uncharacterized protein n=1 Tax=Laodelphax striatellus TaxID=195883 RepID=A0A482WHR4_LAOST|nr:hypothetical protein LSTR_LSTR008701 [Laodelphax striatellus]
MRKTHSQLSAPNLHQLLFKIQITDIGFWDKTVPNGRARQTPSRPFSILPVASERKSTLENKQESKAVASTGDRKTNIAEFHTLAVNRLQADVLNCGGAKCYAEESPKAGWEAKSIFQRPKQTRREREIARFVSTKESEFGRSGINYG